MNPSTTRAGSLSNVARHRPRCAAAARRSESSAAATEKAATAHHRGRPRCSDKHSGHSGAMPAATVGQPQWSAACSGCPQRWGRWYGRLDRYTNVFRVPEHVQRKIGTYPVHLGLEHFWRSAEWADSRAERLLLRSARWLVVASGPTFVCFAFWLVCLRSAIVACQVSCFPL